MSALETQAMQSPPRKRWTRSECAEPAVLAILEKERLELVGGELISKMGKNRRHVNAFKLMLVWLQAAFGSDFVDAEAPIDVAPDDNPVNEPEPDLIVLNRVTTTIVAGNPQPKDISLLVEIADSSLQFDRTVKAPLYARAGVPEYWILDVGGRRLFCHREPTDGLYRSIVVYGEMESIAPLAAPEKLLWISQALPNTQSPRSS